MADWEQIKRLAADFQKIQLSSTIQRLSERNCIEIVSLLTERKIIDLIFTVDGKEYLTSAQLVQDMKNELYVSGGRINLVELAKIIGVDLAHINIHLNEVLKGQRDIHSILGQLIDSSYISKIAGEINERLAQQGQISVSDLTIQYDLPADFLQQNVLEKHLGKLIHGKQDKNNPRVFFTETFIAQCLHKIRGALNGLTRPVPIVLILSKIHVSEQLFFSLFDDLQNCGSLTNRMTSAQYIPDIYSRSQAKWVNTFYKQNDYLEYDTLVRIGIFDYKTYVKKQFSNEDIYFLNSSVVSKRILDRLEADLEECVMSKSYINLQNNLPSVFNEQDIQIILNLILTKHKQLQTLILGNYVISISFLEKLSKNCDTYVRKNAKVIVESGKYQQYHVQFSVPKMQKLVEEIEDKLDKREERRKKATGGKCGGGTQGRETKTKSAKKYQRNSGKNVDDEEEQIPAKKKLCIVTEEEVKKLLEIELETEGLDELVEPLTKHLLPILNEGGLKIAAELYAYTVADKTANRRQTHNELQNKLNALIGDVRLFEKGLKLLPIELQQQLIKYLLKTLCTDIVTEILNYISVERNSNVQVDNFNNEQRVKFINELGSEFKPLSSIVKTLQGQSIDDFMTTIDEALSCCSMIIKKIDKKKDRSVILNHKHELLEQLNKCDDLALILHLTTLVIFTTATQCMLHASGRHVAALLGFLKQFLTEEQANELFIYHDFVTLMLSGGSESENAKEKLREKVTLIKNIANEFKKPGTDKS